MREGSRRFLATLIAVAGGVALAMLTVDTAEGWVENHRCGYRFPWGSGRCIRLEGHKGEHY